MKDRKIALVLTDKTNKQFQFDTFRQLSKFVTEEHQVWSNIQQQLSGNTGNIGHYANAANYFNQINNHLKNFEANLDSWDDSTLQQQIQQQIANIRGNLTQHWIWSGHPFCQAWLNIYEKYDYQVAHTFIEAFIGNRQFSSLNKLEHLEGAILAYEFELQDENTLTKRRNSERASISQIRNSLLETKEQLFNDVNDFQNNFETWDEKTRNQASRLYNINKKLGERLSKQQGNRFDNQMLEWQDNIQHLENTYQEKLRLEKPATYWNTKAKSYFKQGIVWTVLLSIILISGITGFGYLLLVWLKGQQNYIQLDSLHGVALFITTLSIYAFSIKTFSRMAFSSFHLQRDAEEREQLTHVYLALTHEKEELNNDARNIVLQALFSRADTGLLAGDSGPTMPGLHEIVKATSSK